MPEAEQLARSVVARHSRFPGVPHSPGRQKTTCVGSCSWAVVVEARIALAEVEGWAEAEAVAVAGSGASVVVLVSMACIRV